MRSVQDTENLPLFLLLLAPGLLASVMVAIIAPRLGAQQRGRRAAREAAVDARR